MRKLIILLSLVFITTLLADDTELFKVSVPPRAMMVLDYSGSMCWHPYSPWWGCWDGWPCVQYIWWYGLPAIPLDSCRYGILRTVCFDLLDANDDYKVNSLDEQELGVEIGLLRYSGVDGPGGDLDPKYFRVVYGLGDASYSDVWSGIWKPEPWGGTPMNFALNKRDKVGAPYWQESARWYFINKAFPNDQARECRNYAVVLITDGEDTYDCNGTGGSGSPSRRRASVHAAWRLHQLCPDSLQLDSVLVFVVGLGKMSTSYKNVLNWMARWGGTDNPLEPNVGDPNAYSWPDDSCSGFYDPKDYDLSGYAFICEDAQALTKALKLIFEMIKKMNYHFSSVGVPNVISERIESDSCAFIGSFIPQYGSFWEGHLYKVKLDTEFQPVDTLWDAGDILSNTHPDNRRIYTIKNGTWQSFDTTNPNLTPADFGVLTQSEKNAIIKFVRGNTNPNKWYLGDIFHSSPLVVGPPPPFFYDVGYKAFVSRWRNRDTRVYVGANDGMLHVFDGGNTPPSGGDEIWAFIPPDLLPKLKTMALEDSHTYYVDDAPVAYGIWDDRNGDGAKDSTEWKTLLVGGERQGGRSYYFLEITDPNQIPPNEVGYTFSDTLLGETWSTPVLHRVAHWSSNHFAERWFACFGGGLDTSDTEIGRSFYIVDVSGDNNGSNSLGVIRFDPNNTPGLKYCFPSAPAVADIIDSTRPGGIFPDGYADMIYIGDYAGNMWLVDISSPHPSDWHMAKVFESNPAKKLRCFFAPSLALQVLEQNIGDTVLILKKIPWLFWGTGDRANILEGNTRNRFYALRNPDTASVVTELDLDNITGGGLPDTSKAGWYIILDKGEKVVSVPIVFDENVYFTTFIPEQQAGQGQDPCNPSSGTSYLYAMNAWTGKAVFPEGRRKIIPSVGVPGQPKVLFGDKIKLIAGEEVIELPGEAVRVRYESWESTR
ncbi:hypothetical protein DRP53_09055 [candidate division WOR-3 bacterium]|uniref:PilY1 beta-propeller domain-containing protein n=1 Tax=candidate division WOR-3 bacterium TaxID=2052148 RepID=A0A660SEC4_UNCW3|nr:MAG: hypothetical protein DRP53_09055 [candidate division WOR-3 bacterium]